MSEKMRMAIDFIEEAEKNIGELPITVKMEAIPNIIKMLSKAKKGDAVELFIYCGNTGMEFSATVHCHY